MKETKCYKFVFTKKMLIYIKILTCIRYDHLG